ncbi:MAG: hypothetical protein L3K19_01265 [Thermoplasmata archaeon]|nr:hypothetical protein [Thermoplasmata archaeon]
MAVGTTGFAAAVTLLMVLAPAGAGAVHALKVMTPAYKHTVSQPSSSSSTSGCGKSKVNVPKWSPTTGGLSAVDSASASACGKSLSYVGGSSSASAQSGLLIAIPFTVSKNGNHSISSSWTLNLATLDSFTTGGCPAKSVNFNPSLNSYSYGYCQDGAYLDFSMYLYLQDLNNNTWYSTNGSSLYAYNDSYWQNYTDCYNYGTPTCSNTTGSSGYAFQYGYNAVGFNAFTWNGATPFTSWTNGSYMVKSHHYVLVISLYLYTYAFADQLNLLHPWAGTSVATVNMATLGNGATLQSITIA